jgi:hypothetical protein
MYAMENYLFYFFAKADVVDKLPEKEVEVCL